MEIERDEKGDVWFRGMSPLHADTLMRIPEWLSSDDVRVRARLLPPVYEDEEDENQWRNYAVPELEHLFASRAELITKDLEMMEQEGALMFALRIPQAHEAAWLSGLNAARLALFVLHDFEDEDMARNPAELEDLEQELALARIDIMAFMQEMMIESRA